MAQKRTPGLRKRGRYWHIDKVVPRYGHLNESTKCESLVEAEEYMRWRLEELRRIHLYGQRVRVKFKEARQRYVEEYGHLKTIVDLEIALKRVAPYLDDLYLDEIDDEALRSFKQKTRKRITDDKRVGLAAGTINKSLVCTKRVLTLAASKWRTNGKTWLTAVPYIENVVGEKRKPYPLEWSEQRMLFKELPSHMHAPALFAINTGLRQSEFLALRWSWMVEVPEIGSRVFILPETVTKNGEERIVVLNTIARRVVDAQVGVNSTYVFSYKDKPVYRLNTKAYRAARKRAGLPSVRVHDFRHTFAHRLRAAGVGFEDRQALLGHKGGSVTTHYSAPDIRKLIEAVELICDDRSSTILRVVNR
jgi:integrase